MSEHRRLLARRDAGRTKAPPRGRSGFTLVELMISIAIAGVVVVGLYSLFIIQTRQFLYQDLQMEMHQNQRFAMDILTRSVRMAGFGTSGRVTGYLGSDGNVNNDLPVMTAYDGWSGGGGTDALTVVYGEPSLAMGTEVTALKTCGTTDLQFRAGMLDYGTRLGEFSAGEMMLCMDYASLAGMETYLWVLTGAPDAAGLVPVADATSYADYVAICPSGENLSPGMYCSRAQVMTFYIDNSTATTGPGTEDNPVLMVDMDLNWPEGDDVPLVENVEDLQFEYCLVDADGDLAIDDCTGAGAVWVDTFDDADGDAVQMVRMHLLVRSSRTDPKDLFSNSRPSLANHSGALGTNPGGTDGYAYFRQVISTEVTVRNLRLQANL